MLTIQHSFFPDKKSAIAHGIDVPTACSKVLLYQLIALHLGINVDGLEVAAIMDAIDDRNMELACVGVAESCITNESTVLDQMAAAIDKPVLRRDRKPVPKPIKRNAKPVIKYVAPGNTMVRALMAANLVEVN